MRERRTAGGEVATSSKRASNKRTLTNRLLFYKRKKGLSRGYFSRKDGKIEEWLMRFWLGLVAGNSIWFETAQFSIGNFSRRQYPLFGAVERGAVGSSAILSCVSIQEMYLEEYSKCIQLTTTNHSHLYKMYQKIQTMYRKTAQNTHLVSKKQLTIRRNRAMITLYRVGVIR